MGIATVDLRSDTVTRPTRAMREAMFSGEPPEFGEILRVVGEFEKNSNEVHSAE